MVPTLKGERVGCSFALRCRKATAICRESAPRLEDRGNGHIVACFNCGRAAPGSAGRPWRSIPAAMRRWRPRRSHRRADTSCMPSSQPTWIPWSRGCLPDAARSSRASPAAGPGRATPATWRFNWRWRRTAGCPSPAPATTTGQTSRAAPPWDGSSCFNWRKRARGSTRSSFRWAAVRSRGRSPKRSRRPRRSASSRNCRASMSASPKAAFRSYEPICWHWLKSRAVKGILST